MNNYYSNKNQFINDNNDQHFRRIPIEQYGESCKPNLYEETVTTTTTTTINKEENSSTDQMTTTRLERSPLRRVNVVTGPRSAYARLFPDKYRREQDQFDRTPRSKSSDDQLYNFDLIKTRRTINDENYYYNDDNDDKIRKSCHNSFNQSINDRTKSDTILNENFTKIPLNYDPNPEIIYRDNPEKLTYVQKIGVRYLKPPTPPPPEPIIIREIQPKPLQQPPPLVISSTPPIEPRTPSPLIVREKPPTPPPPQPAKVITKQLPAPPATPRRVIIKRIPPLPAKPRPVIIEKWLPYKTPQERPVLYERAEQTTRISSPQRNVILQYEPARVRIEQEIQNVGCFRVDPQIYCAHYGSELRRTDSIRKVLNDIGCNPDILTSTGYTTKTNCPHNQTNNEYSNQARTCFTDQQLSELINNSSTNQNQHLNNSSTTRYYRTVSTHS